MEIRTGQRRKLRLVENLQALPTETGGELAGCCKEGDTLKLITQDQVKQYLSYDPDSGDFRWKQKPSRNIMLGLFFIQNFLIVRQRF